jgi:hypothetical protein
VTPLQFFVVIAAGIAGGVYVWQPLFTKKKVFLFATCPQT